MVEKIKNLRAHIALDTNRSSRYPVLSQKVDESVADFAERVKRTIIGLTERPNWDGYE